MQLAKIKVSGFKSFVDPTSILLPSKLIAIVGPNGCGKSNIIDAVTWVMGESSPKYLRGETSTDVIFNGSSARKPVGQASVDLIFDNQDGTIGGEFAKFSEISVKRVITREADSTYYLNGVRCRKRDVVDLFLGTGLGPRSYSIIGQNMITKMIEAKPDELRTYLEEAAGISKYKERRHETELRISHAKENVARVNDLRAELEKQLSHLKHQANVAEKFKSLKQQERTLRAELYAIQWRELDCCLVNHTLKIQHEETALEARQSELTTTDREMEQTRHEQRVTQDAFNEVQRRYYAVSNEITRIEQDILHHQERQQQWEGDLQQAERDWQIIKTQIADIEEEVREFDNDIALIEPELSTVRQNVGTLQHDLDVAEETMQALQDDWDEFNETHAKTAHTAQAEKNRIEKIEERKAFLQKRQRQLQEDQERIDFSELTKEAESFAHEVEALTETLQSDQQSLTNIRNDIEAKRKLQQEATTKLDKIRNELQQLCGEKASLESLQQTALGQRNNPAADWIKQQGLDDKTRLAQHLQVEKGWDKAVEKILGASLQAICVDSGEALADQLTDFKSGNVCLFIPSEANGWQADKAGKTTLLDKINSPWPLDSLLAGIYTANSLTEAFQLCKSLAPNESVVTPDGIWLNPAWIKILREDNAAQGVFQREHELKQLIMRIDELQASKKQLESTIDSYHEELKKLEQQREQHQEAHHQSQAKVAKIDAQHKMKQQRLMELKKEAERFAKEQKECVEQLKQADIEINNARHLWDEAMRVLEEQSHTRDHLINERDKVRASLQSLREAMEQKKEKLHALEIRLQTNRSQKSAHSQTVTRLQAQAASLAERRTTLQSELASMPPMDTLKQSLSRSLDKHVSIESELNSARIAMEALEQEFRNLETKRTTIEQEINKVRKVLETLRVEWQGWRVKSDTILDQIKETEFTLEDILRDLPPEVSLAECQIKLDQVVQRVNRLGAINLMAIDEYNTCQERKQYLDKQLEDLQSGLATLESAIAKIDRETRALFKDTYDKVNTQFQTLFPAVFGGGKAYLELTNDDLLEAGVSLMACPPGKRNSSIHLLSGGEKSLTAIALIFSIFHLNPAPFCLLDEVDAALDDANVQRFIQLVKMMTEKTQFIFISHNKITIEMGDHLIGVTMNEPGVSRLVSVDIEKAISMAGTKVE